MSVEPTTAERLHATAERAADARVSGSAGDDGPLWHWVARYAPVDRSTQRALYRACRSALQQLRGDRYIRDTARLTPRIVERTIDRYLSDLMGVAEPRGRRARARLKVRAMIRRRAPVDRPAASAQITPVRMAGAGPRRRFAPTGAQAGRSRPANANSAPTPAPAPLLPPEAPLEMPEQDLS